MDGLYRFAYNFSVLEFETRGEFDDEGFVAGADGGEGEKIARNKFAGELDDFGFVDGANNVRNFAVIFDFVGFKIFFGVKVGELTDGLGGHLEATESITFGGGEITVVDFAV